ncbi:hypothetical protein EMCG_02117 [[Emmonsia] crescens]|uniref:NodB homology domain-containing protein n=1 Tax=[Emmonsia] crescens TaxID=73230 RepID=A0A0G2I0C9_9EURO|nr:hypothetical protein EMCG_02117 [Emmonsia crescens UAMH 3008]
MTTNPYTIGTTFPTIQDARKAILRYTVEQSLSYRIVKSDMTRYSLACRAESCTFHLYCNYSRKKKLVIVSVYKPHTCAPETHENWKMARSMQYVVPRLARSFHANRSLKPSEIQESELLNGHRLKYHQAWRARKQLETFLQNHDFEDSVLPDPEEPRKKRVLVGYGIDIGAVANWVNTCDGSPHNPINISRGVYGATVGVERLLKLLEKYDIKATWFAPVHSVESFPKQLAKVRDADHEIGLHGYTHEYVSDLSSEQQRSVLKHSIDVLTKFTGTKPLGFTTPAWKTSKDLIRLLEEHGIIYDHSFMHHDVQLYYAPDSSSQCVETNMANAPESWMMPITRIRPSTVVEIPANSHLDDWPPLQPNPSRPATGFVDTQAVERSWKEQFDYAYREYDTFIFPMSIHPQVSGKPHVILMHERIIEHINHHEGVEWMTFGDMAKEFREGKFPGVTIEGGV